MPEGQTERGERKVIPFEEFRRARAKRDAEREGSGSDPPDRPSDEDQDVSADQALTQITRLLREELEDLPAVRAEKVKLVRDRLRARYYDRPEVLTEIANRMMGRASEETADPSEQGET